MAAVTICSDFGAQKNWVLGEIKLKREGGGNRIFEADNHIREPENLCSVAFPTGLPL